MSRAFITVGFTGPREIAGPGSTTISRVVRNVCNMRCNVAVGDASGVDRHVLSTALLSIDPNRLNVFTILDPELNGGLPITNSAGVQRAAERSAYVVWNAGGTGDNRRRLITRSQRMVDFVAESSYGSGIIGFVSSFPSKTWGGGAWPSCGSGTWSTLAYANHKDLIVMVYPIEFDKFDPFFLPHLPGWQGEWVKALQADKWDGGYMWVKKSSKKKNDTDLNTSQKRMMAELSKTG